MNPFEHAAPGTTQFFVLAALGLVAFFGVQSIVFRRLTGWTTLTKAYPQRKPFRGKRWWFESGHLQRGLSFRGCLTVGANEEGLYVGVLWPFSLLWPAFFAPWADVTVRTGREWGLFRYTELRFAQAPAVPLHLSGDFAPRLARAAGRAWPGETADSA